MKSSYFFDNIKRFFSLNKALIISIIIIIVLGFTTGIFCALKSDETLNLNFIQGFVLRNLLCKNYSTLGFILIKSFILLGFLFLVYFLSYLKFGYVLFIIGVLYFSFLMGIDICVIFTFFGVLKGLLIGILGFLIWQILILSFVLIFGFRMACFNRQMHIYGNCQIRGNELKILLFFGLLILASVILQGFLIWLICKIFVF